MTAEERQIVRLSAENAHLTKTLEQTEMLRRFAQRYGDEMKAGLERAEAEVERVTEIHTDWLAMANGTQEAMVSFMNQDRAEIARLSSENARLTQELADGEAADADRRASMHQLEADVSRLGAQLATRTAERDAFEAALLEHR